MTVRTTNFDAVAASAPLNRDASVARDGSGDLYDKAAAGFEKVNRWIAPPAMTPAAKFKGVATYEDNVGRRVGAFTLLGVWVEGNPKKNAIWVCRCDCGYYEGRRLRGLNSLGDAAACSHCTRTRQLRELGSSQNTKASRQASEALLDAIAAGKRA